MKGKIALLLVFAAAMAFVEAAVVVYLRQVLGSGPLFPMRDLPAPLLTVEVAREAATLAMLVAVARLAFSGGARRMGAFLLLFAAWDVFYYVWLRLAVGWPAAVSDWDILFLIPLPWVGPVWSVLVICAGMIVFAALFLRAPATARFAPGASGWTAGILGSLLIVATYILEWRKIGYGRGIPSDFSLVPFLAGIFLLCASGWIAYRRSVIP
jgi:hypothetical protein